jgi:hypothetical protein
VCGAGEFNPAIQLFLNNNVKYTHMGKKNKTKTTTMRGQRAWLKW